MSKKIKISAKPVKAIFAVQLIILPVFMIFGIALLFIADREIRPYMSIFVLIWEIVCIALVVNAINTLRRIKKGKIEAAEINGLQVNSESNSASKLRDLETLKKDGLISADEYEKKRNEIMKEKW